MSSRMDVCQRKGGAANCMKEVSTIGYGVLKEYKDTKDNRIQKYNVCPPDAVWLPASETD
jgi:hypothetical protein